MRQEIIQTRRKELKYLVNYGQYRLLSSLLSAVMEPDPYGDQEGIYFVRSLYFDSFNGMDDQEKEEGISHRRKIRLRYYSEDPDRLKFETKEKTNLHTTKQSISLTRDEAQSLYQGDMRGIYEKDLRLYEHMKSYSYIPSTLVDYEREAYINDAFQVRINFDMNIRGARLMSGMPGTPTDRELFALEPVMVPLLDPRFFILEVKFNGHMPDMIQKLLSQVELSQISYSKYYYSRRTSGGL